MDSFLTMKGLNAFLWFQDDHDIAAYDDDQHRNNVLALDIQFTNHYCNHEVRFVQMF